MSDSLLGRACALFDDTHIAAQVSRASMRSLNGRNDPVLRFRIFTPFGMPEVRSNALCKTAAYNT